MAKTIDIINYILKEFVIIELQKKDNHFTFELSILKLRLIKIEWEEL